MLSMPFTYFKTFIFPSFQWSGGEKKRDWRKKRIELENWMNLFERKKKLKRSTDQQIQKKIWKERN